MLLADTWYDLMCTPDMNENVVKQSIASLLSSGLRAAGYEYVNLDCCWAATARLPNGSLTHNSLFPSGMVGAQKEGKQNVAFLF